jgi:hypothetical protein
MNIIQIHNKIRSLLDNEKSPRFPPPFIDTIVNTAIDLLVGDRYDNEKKSKTGYSFQSSSKLRDQLYTLVKQSDWIPAVNGVIESSGYPVDLNYIITPFVDVSGTTATAIPLTYEEEAVIEQDPGRRPSIMYPARVYFIEFQSGLRILWGTQGTLIRAKINYLKKPAVVSYGIELLINEILTPAMQIIAVKDDGNSVVLQKLIASPYTEVNINVAAGEVYVVPNPATAVNAYTFKSGIAVRSFTNCDLPNNMHEEVARRAAAQLSGIVENFPRKNDLDKEDKV